MIDDVVYIQINIISMLLFNTCSAPLDPAIAHPVSGACSGDSAIFRGQREGDIRCSNLKGGLSISTSKTSTYVNTTISPILGFQVKLLNFGGVHPHHLREVRTCTVPTIHCPPTWVRSNYRWGILVSNTRALMSHNFGGCEDKTQKPFAGSRCHFVTPLKGVH